MKAKVKVNLLTGEFTQQQIDLALKNYKAKILNAGRVNELLNWKLYRGKSAGGNTINHQAIIIGVPTKLLETVVFLDNGEPL